MDPHAPHRQFGWELRKMPAAESLTYYLGVSLAKPKGVLGLTSRVELQTSVRHAIDLIVELIRVT
eukprot:10006922-Heterocapsa_arctica.AAC.1